MSEGIRNSGAKFPTNQKVEGSLVTSTPAGTDAGPVRHDPEHGTQASGPRGDNPSTAGPGPTAVHSNTPENRPGQLNPSAPEDSNTTPGTTSDK
jgi:hypothetical protein